MSTDVTSSACPSLSDLRNRISRYSIRSEKEFPEAAHIHIVRSCVLVPLFFQDGDIHVLFTIRAPSLRHEPNMAVFPGGQKDEMDTDDVMTAMREAEEEIGLTSSDLEILGTIVPMFSHPHFSVFPVIALISGNFVPVLSDEVSDIFSVPLSRFVQDDYWYYDISLHGRDMRVTHFPVTKEGKVHLIWGSTAFISCLVAAMVYQKDLVENVVVPDGGTCDTIVEECKTFFRIMCEGAKHKSKI